MLVLVGNYLNIKSKTRPKGCLLKMNYKISVTCTCVCGCVCSVPHVHSLNFKLETTDWEIMEDCNLNRFLFYLFNPSSLCWWFIYQPLHPAVIGNTDNTYCFSLRSYLFFPAHTGRQEHKLRLRHSLPAQGHLGGTFFFLVYFPSRWKPLLLTVQLGAKKSLHFQNKVQSPPLLRCI